MEKTQCVFVTSLRDMASSSVAFSIQRHTPRLLSCVVRWRSFEGAFDVRCHMTRCGERRQAVN